MIPYKSHLATAVPQTPEVRIEIIKAICALAAQDEEERPRQWRAELASLRRDLGQIALALHELKCACDPRLRSYVVKYSPEQPRVPAGNPDGGEWTNEDAGAPAGEADDSGSSGASRPVQYAALDTGTRTDATDGGAASDSSDGDTGQDGIELAQNKVTPRGFTVEHLPGENPLDPQGLNKPISADEQQKIAAALTLYFNGDTSALQPHPYANLPHHVTGAVLPESTAGYTAYDVLGLGPGRGEGRLLIDNATRAIYYTNNHYFSFYAVTVNMPGK